MNKTYVGEGKVVLIAGGGKTYCDVAANFCRAEEDLDHLVTDEDTKKIIRHLITSGHTSALEFDQFIFGIEGYARVTEVQLVRKRLASYNIKSGRVNKGGKRQFDVVVPHSIEEFYTFAELDPAKMYIGKERKDGDIQLIDNSVYEEFLRATLSCAKDDQAKLLYQYDSDTILNIIESWYNTGVEAGYKEEELRYLKPQATEFKACIRMDAAALRNWFMIRCCNRAQTEIRDLANKIRAICMDVSPALFEGSGPSCVVLGYCPELEQCAENKGKVYTKKEALEILKTHRNETV